MYYIYCKEEMKMSWIRHLAISLIYPPADTKRPFMPSNGPDHCSFLEEKYLLQNFMGTCTCKQHPMDSIGGIYTCIYRENNTCK